MTDKTIADVISEAVNAGARGEAAVVAKLSVVMGVSSAITVTAPVTDPTWTTVQAALDDIAARLAVLEA